MRGIRVLDLSLNDAGAFCGRLFASTGAEVVVGEGPGGHPLRSAPPWLPDGRSAAWEYLQAYKSARAVGPDPADVVELAGSFDVALLSFEGDPSAVRSLAARLRSAWPRLVVAVFSPFGLTGPYSSYRGGPLEDWAAGGYLALNGEPDREPLPGGGPWVSRLVGAVGAMGAQAALARVRSSGRGDLVDVGAMGALACAHQWSVAIYTHQGVVKRRYGNRHGEAHHPLSLHPCRDGWVCIASVTRPQWEGLCLAMDHPELLAEDDLYVPAARFDRADELDELINGWTSTLPAAEVAAVLQENFCPTGVVQGFSDNLADPHLASRGYFVPMPHLGPTARMPGVPFALDGWRPEPTPAPGPTVGEGSGEPAGPPPPAGVPAGPPPPAGAPNPAASPGAVPRDDLPLAGLRVIEFSVAWAGPLVGRNLADLGADVIKIEHPTSRGIGTGGASQVATEVSSWEWGTIPPPAHRNGVYPDGEPGEHWWNRLGYFNKINRGKRSLCLDVKAPGGREVFEELVRRADVVVNNYSPRGVRSLGIDHPTLRELNPRIVTADLSGFGATGPGAERVSWGPILDAASGLAAATGYPDSGPYKQGLAMPDAVGGFMGTVAVLAALHHREVTGGPVHVDVSQLETLMALAGDQVLVTSVTGEDPPRRGARSLVDAPAGVYRCAGDDQWVALTVDGDEAWRALVGLVGDPRLDRPEWGTVAGRFDGHDEIDAILGEWSAGRPKHRAMAELQGVGVRAAIVATNEDLVNDPHLAERGFMVTLDHVDVGPRGFPGFPLRFEESKVDLRPTPPLGGHNEEILAELGYDAEARAALVASETIATAPPG